LAGSGIARTVDFAVSMRRLSGAFSFSELI
jgi:hypothetical protein